MRDVINNAIRSGPVPTLRDWRSLPTSRLTRAERTMRFCESMLCVPDGDQVGRPLRLEDFQEAFIYALLDNPTPTHRAIFSVGRKNGKSALMACLLLSFVVGPEARRNAQLVAGAMSRDQASLIFKLACHMVTASERLRELVRIVPSSKTLIGLPMNTTFKAIAADGRTAMGLSPRMILIDEAGQISGPTSYFVDSLTSAQGAYEDGLTIYLSTQAPTDADLLSVLIDNATTNRDSATVCHVYTAPDGCELTDEAAWHAANPALGVFRSERDLREQINAAVEMPTAEAGVRNLILNQRVNTDSPFVSRAIWDASRSDVMIPDGVEVWGGLDLSSVKDLTSFAIVGQVGDRLVSEVWAWMPERSVAERSREDKQPYDVWVKQGWLRTCPGAVVDYDFVAQEIIELVGERRLVNIGFDRYRIALFRQAMERMGVELPLVEHGQGFRDMSPSIEELEAQLLNGAITHNGNPVLTMCAANARTIYDAAGWRKFDKKRRNARIDMMIALTMAVGTWRGVGIKETKTPLTTASELATMFSNPLR